MLDTQKRTLLTDTRSGTPARPLFKGAGDSVESRDGFVRTSQYTRLVVRGSKEPGIWYPGTGARDPNMTGIFNF